MWLRWRAIAMSGAIVVGCATGRAVPVEQGYVDPGYDVFDLVKRAIQNIGGEVVAEVRQAGVVTGRIPAEIDGSAVLLEVSIDRRGGGDESWVRASARTEFEDTPKEDLEYWRQRFFEELDALAADLLGQLDRRRLGRPPDAPEPPF